MNGIWYYAIAFIVIWVLAFVFKDQLSKFGVEMNFPLLMWKTKRLRGFIDRIANRAPRFWKWFMNIGLVVSVVCMILMAYALIASLATITQTPSVGLILPGVEVPGSPIYVPFLYGIIGLATVLIVHEFSHGILARVEKINIKSIGLLLFAVLPGAFVEPDDEEMKELKPPSKLRIYAAGSVANLSLAAIAFILMLLLSSCVVPALFHEDGVVIDRTVSDGPSYNILKSGMVLESVNGHSINGSNGYVDVVSKLKPGDNVNVTTDQGHYSFKLGTNPNNHSLGYMGLQCQKNYVIDDNLNNQVFTPLLWGLLPLIQLFNWIFFLNLAVGTFNLLPMKPLDGGYIFDNLLSYGVSEKPRLAITRFFTYLIGIIIVFSLVYGIFSGFM